MNLILKNRNLPTAFDIDSIFEDFFKPVCDHAPLDALKAFDGGFSPRIDVAETKKDIQVSAELPGLDEKDIHVELEEDLLKISGEKKEEKRSDEDEWHHVETSYGKFERRIPLSVKVEGDKVKAEFKKGILKVTLPKVKEEQEKTRTIAIKAA